MIHYGLCQLSAVPMRTEPSNRQEICTQMLFGDTYQLLEYDLSQKWAYIQLDTDGYYGWIDSQQLNPISKEIYEQIQPQPIHISTDPIGIIKQSRQEIRISLGSFLPNLKGNQIKLGDDFWEYKGNSKIFKEKIDSLKKRDDALKFLNTPYLWGGKTIFGIDCSGFTQQVFRLAGIQIPRDAYQQAEKGIIVSELNLSKTADLAFFEREGRIVHVGFIVEQKHLTEVFPQIELQTNDCYIIHALEKVRIDKLDSQGIFNINRKIYTHTLTQLRRFE